MNSTYSSQDLHQSSRSKFVTKVYSILTVQLFITTLFVMANIYFPSFAKFQDTSRFFYFLSFVGVIVPMLILCTLFSNPAFSSSISMKSPHNIVLLAIFTISESYLVSAITSLYTPESVLMSAVATGAATFGITFHALTTKSDYT